MLKDDLQLLWPCRRTSQALRRSQARGREGGGGSGSTIDALADAAVRKLSGAEPRLQLAGQELQFVAQRELVMSLARKLQFNCVCIATE